ncbi:MAG: hydroxymethylbilane synthase [Candidatus Aquicultor secundus]|nr:hydroxymethylbilane synthase [Candidatus Aquicultor secundus]NCO65174.1 hydroxymethylbilane synthase [Solirubrobacter sp.]OIO87135.1 MAG: hydroxymethylbilane synthase [Candidatus Aquicultor secundus]PIU27409.1 MAG: hydroxymethylbilane synthase [Candidatus Aquicultor secundus]PIW22729.1 MAG: hydroxymethylbilane synthase [Candidatus Aquicultor secundus]PIX52036.1 MAG: hydroxymethylbilane synthase [Candidatus Aquicultor secundus]
MTKKKFILGTRGSKLALWQSEHVASILQEKAGVEVELKIIKTQGDKILDVALSRIGDKGLFVKEIETALLECEADLAVHSSKDVPTQIPEGLTLGAFLKRVDPRDVLISKSGQGLDALPAGSVIGTSSLRRIAQILHRRPDLKIEDVRGNLDTRLRKMDDGLFDAIVLAAAGLDRMGWAEGITERIPSDVMLSAVGQGAIAVEVREGDEDMRELMTYLEDPATRAAVTAERALLRELEGGCQIPIGALGVLEDGVLKLDGMVAGLDGSRLIRDSITGAPEEADELGVRLADKLKKQGADEILAEVRAEITEVPAEITEVPKPIHTNG